VRLSNVCHHFSNTVLILLEDIPPSVQSSPTGLLRFLLYSLIYFFDGSRFRDENFTFEISPWKVITGGEIR